MKCFHCEEPARGVCSFYGRALCKEHMKKMPELYKMENPFNITLLAVRRQ